MAGLAPFVVLVSFGIFHAASGLLYRLPIPVQPMKAVSAVLITSSLSAGEIAAAGLCFGLILLVLAVTGAIARFARLVPQSVVTGLQLGLGITLALLSLDLMAELPWLGIVTALLLGLGLIFADRAAQLLALIPLAGVGALLLFSAADLAFSRRLFDARRSCWPVIGVTAAATAWIDPFWGLLAGGLAEIGRGGLLVLLRRRPASRRAG